MGIDNIEALTENQERPELCVICEKPAGFDDGPVCFLWRSAEAMGIELGYYHPSCAQQAAKAKNAPPVEHRNVFEENQ
jgi:hypothetical protein